MRFVVDCMLGKLAKWLRMLGYDTVYLRDADDDTLVRIAVREDRVLLTRDLRLLERSMVRGRSLYVGWGGTAEQLKEVLDKLSLVPDEDMFFTRCTICNTELVPATKEGLRDRVPPYVYATQERFAVCPACDKVYWRGTHADRVLAALPKLEAPESEA